ncbi:hypothetical protein phiV141_11 [Vibrio phage phiV141]|uniref:Uncharacterized protein n=1 Tax=Vibrio phage phiV141 TaxID=2723905 RepID=A0A7D7FA68_9CAUD|nr:hypothetical protein phiV141_11 [Vibrio phage phiV141]
MNQLVPGMTAPAMAQATAATVAAPVAAAQAPAPASNEVAQVAAPADFNIMAFAVHKEKAESSNARKAPWECTVEELRERVTFRDVQAPSNRNSAEYHLRPFLSPKSLPLEEVLGADANGNAINTIIVPAQYADAAKEQFINTVVNAGYLDQILLRTAQELKVAKEERDAAPKKAPVDTAAADAALADLEAANVAQTAPVAPTAQVAPVAAPVAEQAVPQAQVAPTAQAIPQMPAGMPAGIPNFPG